MLKTFKKLIPFEIKISVLMFFYKFQKLETFGLRVPKKSDKHIFIFLAADYGNLGDVAITYAQHKFIQQNFPNFLVTEIPISKTIEGVAFVKKIISTQDIVTTVGGGNMGDLYPMIESFRQLVISTFKENLIISFPQTIDFSETNKGLKALNKAVNVYSNHNNLILLAREQKTYDFFIDNFKKNKAFLVPDIVMTLNKSQPQKERKGVIICLRDDKEKKLNKEEEAKLLKIINNRFKNKKNRDTHIGGNALTMINRVKALHSIWDDFKTAEIVITDRLHGMIFCYITNTPAIVFLNNNHKVKSSFHWIKKAKHIHLMEDFSEKQIEESITFLKNKENIDIKENLLHFYSDLIRTVNIKI